MVAPDDVPVFRGEAVFSQRVFIPFHPFVRDRQAGRSGQVRDPAASHFNQMFHRPERPVVLVNNDLGGFDMGRRAIKKYQGDPFLDHLFKFRDIGCFPRYRYQQSVYPAGNQLPYIDYFGFARFIRLAEKKVISQAGGDFIHSATYAAAMERSSFILDQGYHFNYYTDSAGADFITDTGGDIGLGFRLDGQWVYRTRDMHRPPVILASYPDMVRYAFYPFEGVRVEGWFVVHSSRAAMLDLRIVNERKKKLQLEVVPFMRKSGESFRKTGQPFRNIQSEGSLIRFEHTELPDKWTLGHGVPYADSIRNVFMLSEQTERSGLFAAGETPSGEDSLIAFSRRVPLSWGDSSSLRIVWVVDTLGGKAPLEAEARQLMDQELGPYQQANEKLFARTPIPNFGDPEKDALYWSAVNMMRQVFYPPEGKSEYNYYVFSREPTWGWGHGGQVFHESITMLAYALID